MGRRSEVGIGMEELAGVGSGAARGSGSHGASNFLASLGASAPLHAEADDSVNLPGAAIKKSPPKKGPAKSVPAPTQQNASKSPPTNFDDGSTARAPALPPTAKKKTDLTPYWVGVGVPLAIGLIGSLVILDQKGYFTFFRGGKGVQRQDASAFADFSRSAAKDVTWHSAPPTGEFDRVANLIASGETEYPTHAKGFKALRKKLEGLRSRNAAGNVSNNDALLGIQDIQADYRKLVAEASGTAELDDGPVTD